MKKKYILILCCVIALAGIMVTACKPKASSKKPIVYVTIDPLRYFAEQIAGNYFEMVVMVPQGRSPETYDPTPQQLMQLAEGKAYLFVGQLGFEQQWIQKLAENAPNVKFCNTSEGIHYLKEDRLQQHEKNHNDPHTWTTPANALIISKNICSLFCEIDPGHQEEYVKNYSTLSTRIQQTDAKIRKLVAEGMQHTFGIYHPSLTYFANDYGLEQLCIENNGKEPSAAQLEDFIQRCREKGVRTIFIQQEFDSHNAEIIAKEVGAKLTEINPINYQWHDEMEQIAQTLKQ